MADQPLTGVGPGRFGLVSPTARADRDTRSAHNEFLHQGAESGVVGFLMLLVVFMAVLGRLRFTPSPDAFTALGAVAIAVLGIHASVDYVLRFPALSVVASALAGAAAAPIGWRRMASA